MLAVDISNYTEPLDAKLLYDSGVRKAIVQTVNPNILSYQEQIPLLRSQGIEVEGYVYLWMDDPKFCSDRVRWACQSLRAMDVPRIWLDVEDETADKRNLVPSLDASIDAAGDMLAGIYTGKWYWDNYMGGITKYSHLPLWVAQYDNTQDLYMYPFGGWTSCVMKQYAGQSTIPGITGIDMNWYEEGDLITKLNNTDAVSAFMLAVNNKDGAIAQQDGQYIATMSGSPDGYEDIVIRVRK